MSKIHEVGVRRVTRVHDEISFTWPAAGTMQVTLLPSGGCNVKFIFADRGIVRSIGRGRIVKVRNIFAKRIAQQFEIIIRHDDDFESSYSIVDQTPSVPASGAGQPMMLGTIVEHGSELYEVLNGGLLHFQLFRSGELVDPRRYIRTEYDGQTGDPHDSPEA
jgi:hypothetical protein